MKNEGDYLDVGTRGRWSIVLGIRSLIWI